MTELIQNFLSAQVVLFLIFGLGAVVAAITTVLHPNPIRSALFLVLNLFCVAVLYLLLNAYFLAVVQVIVYAGAIMVLFLFVIMLLNLGTPERQADRLKWQQPVALVAGVALAVVVGVAIAVPTPPAPEELAMRPPRPGPAMASAGVASQAVGGGGGPRDLREGPGGRPRDFPSASLDEPEENVAPGELTSKQRDRLTELRDQGTTKGIGRTLYDPTQPYLFPFEAASILLLIAVIGSVVLAKRRMPGENLASSSSGTIEETI